MPTKLMANYMYYNYYNSTVCDGWDNLMINKG